MPSAMKLLMSSSVIGVPALSSEASLHPETVLAVPPVYVHVSVFVTPETDSAYIPTKVSLVTHPGVGTVPAGLEKGATSSTKVKVRLALKVRVMATGAGGLPL